VDERRTRTKVMAKKKVAKRLKNHERAEISVKKEQKKKSK